MTLPHIRKKGADDSSRGGKLWKVAILLSVLVLLCVYSFFSQLGFEQPATSDLPGPAVVSSTLTSSTCLDLQVGPDVKNRIRPLNAEISKCLLYAEPSVYIKLIMKVVLGTPNQGRCNHSTRNCAGHLPYVPELRQYGNDWPPFGYTMVGMARLENVRAAIDEVNRNQIPGIIAELGVWRGGAMITAAAVVKESGIQRDVYLFDAFDLIPGYGGSSDYLANSMEEVQDNFELFELRDDNIHFVKGLFKDTVPTWKDKEGPPIAVLRVDGNFYDSYQDAMYYMYEKVPVGGIVIFDDVMTHPAVMQFWLDFKQEQSIPEELNRIDKHSAWFRKMHEVKLDFSKMHPPRDANK